MKKYLLIVILITACLVVKANTSIKTTIDSAQKTLPDGQYYADISYYNYATYTSADYTDLKVKVKDGQVIVIHLNNGGIVHYGINNENYLYTGGKLEGKKNKKTAKIEYTTQVSISNGNNIVVYKITILKDSPDERP
jgi:hypothetical protein